MIGIPYSQTPNQVDEKSFKSSMNNSNFYTPYSSSMSMYGSDCSGFVSFAFYVSGHTTWTLVSDSLFTKLSSLDNLLPGDAVVTNVAGKEHTFIINYINGDTLGCYEQTQYYARATTHSKADLKNNKYRGIRNYDWGGAVPYSIGVNYS